MCKPETHKAFCTRTLPITVRFGILSGLHGMENSLTAGNGEKMGPEMHFRGNFHFISISGPFFDHFCCCQAPGRFPFGFPFFPISGCQAVFHSVQARQNPNVRCCFAPPSVRNLRSFLINVQWLSPKFSWTFSQFQSMFSHFQSISVTFSNFQSVSRISNQFRSLSITWTQSKTQECIDNRKVVENNTQLP